jgi:O-antigen/teichoic acid export membrane protein
LPIDDPTNAAPTVAPEQAPLPAQDVRRRATSGAGLLVVRGLAIRAVGFLGNIILARLLIPADFGAAAIGSAIIVFISLISDGGLGAALIRGDHSPPRIVFEQLLGLQLAIAGTLTIAAFALGPLFGRVGWAAAVMTSTSTIAVFGTASSIHLERNLMFRQLARIDVLNSVGYMMWAIPAAALGTGVWALVSANIVQVVLATALYLAVSPLRVLRPRFGLGEIRPLLSFGARFQAINAVNLVRDQGLNVGVAAIAGVGTLGVWTMAYRFIQVPFLLFESLWRVTFPGMARLMEAGEDPRPAVERLLGTSSVATGAIMCTLVGSTPALIPAVFAHRWQGIVDVLPWACGGLLVGGPISVAVAGYLFAQGDASTVLRGAILHTSAALAVGLALLPVLGIAALGLSAFSSALVEGAVLGLRATRTHRIHIVRPLLIPTLVSIPAAGLGWWIAGKVDPVWLGAVAGAATGLGTFLILQIVADRAALTRTAALVNRTVRSTFTRAD